ncbi:MAG: Holliday junction resolvase YqgF [Betaproteobacteria bacterium]|nr:Holliday junction resolvase YqgF [Betaproteobacteria bacterium]
MREPHPPAQQSDAPRGRNSALEGTAVLAFDFGEQRIGAAVGDTVVGIAHPLTTISAADKKTRYAAIAGLIQEWRPALLVVGLPFHLDGTEHEMSRLARKFARELGGRFNLPVELVDERLTSDAADMSLAEAGVAGHKRKPVIDQVAALHILQAYLDERARQRHLMQAQQ